MQGTFYGAFLGKKKNMLPLLSKLGENRENTGAMVPFIFSQLSLPDNWNELGDEEWVKAQYASEASMNINYLEGGLFSDLGMYMLEIEGFTCTQSLDSGFKQYTYSPYNSLDIIHTDSKMEAQSKASEFEISTKQTSITRDKQTWYDSYTCNAVNLIPNQVLPAPVDTNSSFLIKNDVLISYLGDEEEVIIPDTCSAIGSRAFENNQTLQRVVIPSSVKTIGDSAFYNCTALKELVLNTGLKQIDDFAFCHTALKKVELPNGVISLGYSTFPKVHLRIPSSLKFLESDLLADLGYNNTAITSIELPDKHPVYSLQNGCLFRKKDKVLLFAQKDLTGIIEIPEGTSEIADGAFKGVSSLEGIRIPNSVTKIGSEAFRHCSSLKSVELPEGLTKIDPQTFDCCYALESIKLPEGLSSIEFDAFDSCKHLSAISFPESLTSIGSRAFSDCKSLKEVTLPYRLQTCPTTAFPTETKLISDFSEVACRLLKFRTVEFHLTPNRNYTGQISPKVLEILIEQGDLASFESAISFVPDIWNWIPNLLCHARFCKKEKIEAYLLELEQKNLAKGKKPKALTVAQWKKLWTFHDNKDGTYTAYGYRGSSSHASLPETLGKAKIIGFEDHSENQKDKFPYHWSLRTLTLPSSFHKGAVVINNDLMPMLEHIEVQISGTGQNYSSKDGILYNGDGTELIACPSAKKGIVVVPEGVKIIHTCAFLNCRELTEIQLPNSLRVIQSKAFVGCHALTSLTIPDGTEDISKYTFMNCNSLKIVTIPASVKKINFDSIRTGPIGGSLFGRSFTLRTPAGSAAEAYVKNDPCSCQKITLEIL